MYTSKYSAHIQFLKAKFLEAKTTYTLKYNASYFAIF